VGRSQGPLRVGSCVFTLDLSNLALRKSKSTWDFELNFLNILLQAQLPSSNLFSLTKETFYSFKDFDCCCSLMSHKPNHISKHWMNDCNGSNVDKQAKTNLYPHFLLSFFSKRLKHKTLYYCIGTFEDLYLLNTNNPNPKIVSLSAMNCLPTTYFAYPSI
jgi:hypothetical protein